MRERRNRPGPPAGRGGAAAGGGPSARGVGARRSPHPDLAVRARPPAGGPHGSRGRRGAAPPRAARPRERRQRPPWWTLAAATAGFGALTGWVAAQPLPPKPPNPALAAVESRITAEARRISGLRSQAAAWQAQQRRIAAILAQEEAVYAQLTGSPPPGTAGVGSAPLAGPPIAMSGAS